MSQPSSAACETGRAAAEGTWTCSVNCTWGRLFMSKVKLLVVSCLSLILILLVGAEKISAQAVYGNIIGTVTDSQGAAIANAKVTVTSVTKGTSEETTTNES